MRRKPLIMIGFVVVVIILITIIVSMNNLLPEEVGVLIVNDGMEPTTSPISETIAVATDTATVIPTEVAQATDTAQDADTAQATDTAQVVQEDSQMFHYEELSQEIKNRITGVSYAENCDVPYEELRYVTVLYYDFDGETHNGELIVNKAIAEDIVDIFKELYDQKYSIEQMVLIDEYQADDNLSMAADNTSAFNYRPIDDGSGRLSIHSYGLAIDINPLYNPYVREVDGVNVISPENGAEYEDRSLDCEYYIKQGDICYEAFVSRGFTWGGDWKNQKDYQHFQKKLD